MVDGEKRRWRREWERGKWGSRRRFVWRMEGGGRGLECGEEGVREW